MERYANVVVAVIALLCCLQPFSQAKSLKTQLEIDERQLLNVLPSWLERLRNNLPSSLTGRVKPLVLFELMSIKYFLATNYFITHMSCRLFFVFFCRVCHRMCQSGNRPRFWTGPRLSWTLAKSPAWLLTKNQTPLFYTAEMSNGMAGKIQNLPIDQMWNFKKILGIIQTTCQSPNQGHQ